MELSWKSALRVVVSDGGSRRFLLIYLNVAVKYFVVAMSVAVAVGMMNSFLEIFDACPSWLVFYYCNFGNDFWFDREKC